MKITEQGKARARQRLAEARACWTPQQWQRLREQLGHPATPASDDEATTTQPVTVQLPAEDHRLLRLYCLDTGKTEDEAVAELLHAALDQEPPHHRQDDQPSEAAQRPASDLDWQEALHLAEKQIRDTDKRVTAAQAEARRVHSADEA